MAMTVQEIREWLDTLSDEDEVGVDDTGLTLRVVGDLDSYCEVGGLPEEDKEE